jgi:phosphatidylserine decarboxylase
MNKYFSPDPPSALAFPIAKAGYPIIFAMGFLTFVLALLGFAIPALAGLAGTFFCCWFFRDPDRVVPNVANAVVSPADGKVVAVETLDSSSFSEGPCVKLSIFMSVFNVHVNRVPYDGTITRVSYYPGKFFSANLDKASKHNEHNAVFVETGKKNSICFVQIAGIIARRIICKVQEGDMVGRGQRYGMICFGSRLDIYLPADTKPNVSVGTKVKSGTSIVAFLYE